MTTSEILLTVIDIIIDTIDLLLEILISQWKNNYTASCSL